MEKYIFKQGVFIADKKILNIYEGLYLIEKGKIDMVNEDKILNEILKNKNIKKSYIVYKYLKEKNIKFGTGMKFGGTFRVYEDPNDIHSKWICFPVYEEEKFTIYDFLAKNRVAHSTRKSLLIAVVDDTKLKKFLEIKWKRL